MMLFGGERDGQALNEMWRFHFATEFWEKLTFPSPTKPMPRAQTTAFILSQFRTRGAVHFMGLHEQDYFGSQPDPEKRNITTLPVPQSLSNKHFAEPESLYEEIDESQVGQKSTYTFADPDNCLLEQDEDATPEVKPRKIYEKLPGLVRRQPNNFQRMVEHPLPSANASSQMSLKVKMSNMNLSKMSAYSNYSMFSNESNESLNTTSNTEPNEKSSIHTMTESVTEDTTSPISPSSIKLNFSMMKKSQSMISSSSSSKDSSVGSVIARDKSLQSFTQALIHAEPDIDGTNPNGAGYKKADQENIYEVVDMK